MTDNENKKIAVFFDAENVSSKKVPQIISFLNKKGEILVQRAYADWSIPSTNSWREQLSKIPITAIQQFHEKEDKGSKKDPKESVDKAIMMDCIEMAIKHTDINIFALIASDNGYYALALHLRELGKRVIGMGEKSECHSRWVNSCNEFSYLDDLEDEDNEILLDLDNSENKKENADLQNFSLEKFLEKAYDSTPKYKNTNVVLLSQFWESVLRMKPDFNVARYNKNSPLEFIKSYEDKFIISDDGKPQRTYFVEKLENTFEEKLERKNGIIKREIFSYCIITADDGSGDYFFYKKDVNLEFKNSKFKKGTKVNFAIIKFPNQEATETKDKNGKAADVKITTGE